MLHVNLIRDRAQADQRVTKTTSFCLLAVAVCVVGSALIAVPALKAKSTQSGKIETAERLLGELATEKAIVDDMSAQLRVLTPVAKMVQECQWSAVDWLRVLMAIHRNIPDTVWLEKIQTECDAEAYRHTVTITGKATKHSEVAAVMARIGQTNPFKNDKVKLLQTSETPAVDDEVYTDFAIEAELQYVIGENLH